MAITIVSFLADNYDEIIELERLYRMDSFQAFTDDKKQARIYKKLLSYGETFVESPEELIIREEDNKAMLKACLAIKRKIGEKKFHMMWLRYGYQMKISKIADQMGYSKQYVSKAVRQAMRDSLRTIIRMIRQGVLDKEVLSNKRGYYVATTPQNKLRYPCDSAKETWVETTVRKNQLRYKTKCMIPEYLQDSFGDKETLCILCQNHLGESTCTRKSMNKCKKENNH